MFTWIKKIGDEKPDHPLFNTKEAKKFLDDLPENDPLTALDEINSWLISVKDTPGFRPDTRAEVISLLDETGQPMQTKLLQQFLAAPHLLDFKAPPPWEAVHHFMVALADAYAVCLHEHQQEYKDALPLKEQSPLLCARLLHAVSGQIKLQLMRYQEVEKAVWEQLYQYYSFAETGGFAGTMVQAYPAHHTSAQRELLSALVLHISSPTTLSHGQIDACQHIAARMSGLFDFKQEPDPDCRPYFFDFSNPGAPAFVDATLQITETMRFFGAVNALPKVKETIHEIEQNILEHGRGLRDEFTPDGKLTVLRHLCTFWTNKKLFRQQERHKTNSTIEVAHGFENVSRLVKCVELSKIANLSEEDAAMLQKKASEMTLTRDGARHAPETWPMLNRSDNGVGGLIPKTAGDWVRIGCICGVRATGSNAWEVGMLRRIQYKNDMRVGIRIFAQRPLSVWLRSMGKGTVKTAGWENSSDSLTYDYLPVILVPDAQNLFVRATMLMESGSYAADNVYEMMMGQKSCNIKLTGLIEEGEDYEQVSFQWL